MQQTNGVPQIFPALPVNLPGAPGSNQGPVATQTGIGANAFVGPTAQALGEVFNSEKTVPIEPPVFEPALNFQVK